MRSRIKNLLIVSFIALIFSSAVSMNYHFEYARGEPSQSFDLFKTGSPETIQKEQNVGLTLQQVTSDQSNKIKNQYIVVFKNSVKNVNSLTEQLTTNIQANSLMPSKMPDMKVLDIFDKSVKGAVFKINDIQNLLDIVNDPNVLYVEQDQKIYSFAQQIPKGINRIDADLSYARSGSGAGTVNADIAIIDSGISYNHPDLNIYKRVDFTGGSALYANDQHGHGSHVAGIAAAKDNSVGVVGVAPGARLWNLKVLDSTGTGSISTLIKALDYVTANAKQIEVANISLGCQCSSQTLNTAISNVVKAGVIIVAAAGNAATNTALYSPASNPNVIAVSAIVDTDGKCGGKGGTTSYGLDDTLASFSNYGQAVDIAAPGVSIFSTYKSNSYTTMTGTSMAAPHVAGAVALYKASHPTATPLDIIDAIKKLAVKSTSICDNNGRGYFKGDRDVFLEPLLYVRNY